MPTRFRRSLKIAPGIHVNVGKSGITGVSFGGRGFRRTIGTSGLNRTSVGIPGTGFSVYSYGAKGTTRRRTSAPPTLSAPPHPGIFARPIEKHFYDGLQAYRSDDLARARGEFQQASALNPRQPSPYLFGALIAVAQGDHATALNWLEWVVKNGHLPDDLMAKYTTTMDMIVSVTPHVLAHAAIDGAGPALALAELYQEAGRLEEAIGLVQQLHQANPTDAAIRLSLADLLYTDHDDEAVIELAAGISNDSDVNLGLLHLKAKALLHAGMHTAALAEFTGCLSRRSGRDPELLRDIRYDRAAAYEQAGQKARARAEWERLYADDPTYRDVKQHLGTV
jgi:tetratricopeptide (TPR) repeat protein